MLGTYLKRCYKFLFKVYSKIFLLVSTFIFLSFSIEPSSFGAVFPEKGPDIYIKDVKELKASITLPTEDKVQTVKINPKVLRERISKVKDPGVEEFYLRVPKNQQERMNFANKLARPGKAAKLYSYFNKKYRLYKDKDQKENANSKFIKVVLDKQGLELISYNELSEIYPSTTHKVIIDTAGINSKATKTELYKQVKEYLNDQDKKNLKRKLNNGISISLKDDLLPTFAKKMVDNFVPFKGPNCFHAALAFQGENFAKAPYVNVKKQKGYHDLMINYDELWDAVTNYFYEVDTSVSSLKYGDLLVFFDLANKKDYSKPYYTWIRHTSTYLFGNYTFSKGSKSANSAYTIKTLDEEWSTWSAYVKNLGIKVFRKNNKYATKQAPKSLEEWIY